MTETSYLEFLPRIAMTKKHESVLEHFSVTAELVCDRGVSHEVVRHRIASYTQESTRYCNYANDKFGNEITVIDPFFYKKPEREAEYVLWKVACEYAQWSYLNLLEKGSSPQEARSVLPNSLKTELAMTANLREWRHFFKLRTHPSAHPQMRELTLICNLFGQFKTIFAPVFDDVEAQDGRLILQKI